MSLWELMLSLQASMLQLVGFLASANPIIPAQDRGPGHAGLTSLFLAGFFLSDLSRQYWEIVGSNLHNQVCVPRFTGQFSLTGLAPCPLQIMGATAQIRNVHWHAAQRLDRDT